MQTKLYTHPSKINKNLNIKNVNSIQSTEKQKLTLRKNHPQTAANYANCGYVR